MLVAGCSWKHGHVNRVVTTTVQAGDRNPEFTHYDDAAPNVTLDPAKINNATPRYEKRTRAGNPRYYTIAGETYWVRKDVAGYREAGGASWYGTQYHGKKTSNGEVYDMYAMSAAHKTLPIPCYARVTRRDNGKSIIVRVNDRGPFIDGRVIDLSYAAATKLGIVKKGTAQVVVEGINTDVPGYRYAEAPSKTKPQNTVSTRISASSDNAFSSAVAHGSNQQNNPTTADIYFQVGVFSQRTLASSVSSMLASHNFKSEIVTNNQHHKVRVGPFDSTAAAKKAATRYRKKGLGNETVIVKE